MADWNEATIIGRLTADPELRQTNTGVSVLRITVAVNRHKPKDGSEAQTDFIEVSAFDKRAEMIARNFRKGSHILVHGRIQVRRWDKNGEKRQSTEIAADEIRFIDPYDPTANDVEATTDPVVSVPSRDKAKQMGLPIPPSYQRTYGDQKPTFEEVPDPDWLPF